MQVARPGHMPSPGLSRRSFLIAAGGAGAAAVLAGCGSTTEGALTGTRIGPGSPQIMQAELARRTPGQRTVDVALDAVSGPVDIGARTVHTWSYGGEVPGKEIRIRRGDLLRAQVSNHLPAPTTVHWHGIALRNDMDGVPVLTQPSIAPGASMRYEFTVPDPGTYWLHPHVGPQLDRGLQAPLIIEDPADGAGYDQELVVVFDDWLDGTGRTPDQVLADLQAPRHGRHGRFGRHGDGAVRAAGRRRRGRHLPLLPGQRPHPRRAPQVRGQTRAADPPPHDQRRWGHRVPDRRARNRDDDHPHRRVPRHPAPGAGGAARDG